MKLTYTVFIALFTSTVFLLSQASILPNVVQLDETTFTKVEEMFSMKKGLTSAMAMGVDMMPGFDWLYD